MPGSQLGVWIQIGAGISLEAGALYNVDQLITIGIEYNLVRDLVNNDPELQRLMFSARIPLFLTLLRNDIVFAEVQLVSSEIK
jgi:hypothetical protein